MEPLSLLPVGLRLAKAKPVCALGEGPGTMTSFTKSLTTCTHVYTYTQETLHKSSLEDSQPKGSTKPLP